MYKINYNTYGDNYILQAMQRADEFIELNFEPVIVHNDDFSVIAIRYWIDKPNAYPTSFDIIKFDDYGYYTPWVISVIK